ncbi:hypothetical protein [Candidatus Odyssella acanthamoebae]|uniref:Uncharacterized protein n=1 Tax=Candidatus Odyssella acanthamoebae TaxID=91604 RepID=A0A077B0Q8_9PROT|nr:hypothetical protein [Candidatus Paracaedibacter acanthamoebae]AIK96505.1 hypothetical protein ID47_06750 [Candidatus Paracaedibacter acanthamoebae]
MPLKIILTTLLLSSVSTATEISSSLSSRRPLKSILKKAPQPVAAAMDPQYSIPENYDADIHRRQISKLLDLNIPFPSLTLKQSWSVYYNSLLEWAKIYSEDNKEIFSDYSTPSISFDSLENYYIPLARLLLQGFMKESSIQPQMLENCLHSIEFYARCGLSKNYYKTEYSLNRMGTPESLDDDDYFNALHEIYIKLVEIRKPATWSIRVSRKLIFNLEKNTFRTFTPSDEEIEELRLHHAGRESRKQHNILLQHLSYERRGVGASMEEIHEHMYLLDWLYESTFAPVQWSYILYSENFHSKEAVERMAKCLPIYDQIFDNLRMQNIEIGSEDFKKKFPREIRRFLGTHS